jgi:hypothetical protein
VQLLVLLLLVQLLQAQLLTWGPSLWWCWSDIKHRRSCS